MARNAINFGLDFGRTAKLFPTLLSKNRNVVTLMGHQELIAHQIITHWIHMEDMKWLSSN
jgi:hypothetical protein